MNKVRQRRGLTLVEIMVVLLIVVIVTLGFGASASRSIKRTNRETVVNELQVLASGLSDAYYDLGNPSYDPGTAEGASGFRNFLQIVASEYIGYTFDEPQTTTNGFYVEVADPLDTYEQKYKCWFVTKDGFSRYVIVASGGDDGKVSFDGYKDGNYSDDIVLILAPKIKS